MKCACLLLLCGFASAEIYRVDPENSKVSFDGTSTMHDFHGTAAVLDGGLKIDSTESAGFVEVSVASMNTKNPRRDRNMRKEVMDADDHPTIRFELRRFWQDDAGGHAEGIWIMHGVKRDITIPVTFTSERVTTDFPLDIRQWNIKPPKVMFVTVDPTVQVHVDLALIADANALTQ